MSEERFFDFGEGEVPAHRHPNGGGWVADTASVEDTCYVGILAQVYDRAWVFGKVRVYDRARVFGKARVSDGAWVSGEARVFGKAWVSGEAWVFGEAQVSKAPIVISGLQYPTTISDNVLTIGYQQHSLKKWHNFTDDEILKMDGKRALAFWRAHKSGLLAMCENHMEKNER